MARFETVTCFLFVVRRQSEIILNEMLIISERPPNSASRVRTSLFSHKNKMCGNGVLIYEYAIINSTIFCSTESKIEIMEFN